MKKIENKIKKLEEEIRDDFWWGSTRLDPTCLTETEKRTFNHILEMFPPTKFDPKNVELTNKSSFYAVRRALDLFIRIMNTQLTRPDERFVFWSRFIDFISETMYIINCGRGSDFVLNMRFGEDVDDWPEEDDPAWKDFFDWKEKWDRNFKNFWEKTSITAEKLFFQNRSVPPEDDGDKKEEIGTDMMELFGEVISVCLTTPSYLDIVLLAMVSSKEPEFLDRVLKRARR